MNGVPGDEEHTVSLLVGDSVTLQSGVSGLPSSDTTRWLFNNTRIAEISEGTRRSLELKGPLEKFKERLQLDVKTGSLNITNISTEHVGEYKLEIRSKTPIIRTFKVTVKDKKPRGPVKEGKNVFLITEVKDIQTYDLILNFKGHTIAEIYKNDGLGNIIRDGRLLLDILNGSLIISDSATTDTGDYNLTMSGSAHSLQSTINVTVSSLDSGVATGAEAGIVVGLLVFLWCLLL